MHIFSNRFFKDAFFWKIFSFRYYSRFFASNNVSFYVMNTNSTYRSGSRTFTKLGTNEFFCWISFSLPSKLGLSWILSIEFVGALTIEFVIVSLSVNLRNRNGFESDPYVNSRLSFWMKFFNYCRIGDLRIDRLYIVLIESNNTNKTITKCKNW